MQRFTGKQYLAIDIANNFGADNDKKTWSERLDWFNSNEHQLMSLLNQAETPALYYAGVQAWEQAKKGIPSGYPISLDGTCSGLQILAVLTGDRFAASICNVINTGKREDAYVSIYEWMVANLGEGAKINRKETKAAIMTSYYGSEATPKEVFGEGKLLGVFYEAMQLHSPAAWELNEAFLAMWDSEALMNSWVLPDNFHVHIKVMGRTSETVHFLNKPYEVYRQVNEPKEKGRSLCANVTHSIDGMMVRELGRRCDYNIDQVRLVRSLIFTSLVQPLEVEETENTTMVQTLWELYKKSGYLSARIIDYIDEDSIWLIDERAYLLELIESFPDKPFKILTVHDCFRCLPAYGNDLREQYNRQLYLIAKSDMLSYLISQIMHKTITIGKLDPNLYLDILEADYSLA